MLILAIDAIDSREKKEEKVFESHGSIVPAGDPGRAVSDLSLWSEFQCLFGSAIGGKIHADGAAVYGTGVFYRE